MKGIDDTTGRKNGKRRSATPLPPSADILVSPYVGIVDVVLGLADFVDIIATPAEPGDARLSSATWTLRNPKLNVITQPVANGPIIVWAEVDIVFELPPDSEFVFTGVSFTRIRGSGSGTGSENFPKDQIKISADGHTITIRDKWKDHGKPGEWTWELHFFIQNVSGDIGIIDPDIENQF